jgi:hypothetical protein
MAVDAQGLFGSVVHDAPANPIAARGLFASVVHSGIVNPVSARGLFASIVHEGTAAGGGGGSDTQGRALQGDGFQGGYNQGDV